VSVCMSPISPRRNVVADESIAQLERENDDNTVFALEEQVARLQELICQLLLKNERLRQFIATEQGHAVTFYNT
jgi:hypothetical protein